MESKVFSLLGTRPFLTVVEAATQIGVSDEEMRQIFYAVASSNKDEYQLLSCSVEEAANGHTTAFVMQKADERNVDITVHALMSLTYPSNMTASLVPVQLQPNAVSSLRAYPLETRAVLESRAAGTPSPVAQPAASVTSAELPVVTQSPKETERSNMRESVDAVSPTGKPTEVPGIVSPPKPKDSLKDMPPSTTVVPLKQEVLPCMPSPSSSKESNRIATPSPKVSIFDKMKEAAATKRPRTAEPTTKLRPPAKSRAVSKSESTVSLAKLARASKKKSSGTSAATAVASASSPMSFLDDDDDDDGDTATCLSRSQGSVSHTEAFAQEEAPVLDVVEVSASNDEVIMYDDAPPLAFRPSATATATTEVNTKKGSGVEKIGTAAVAEDARTAQGSLLSFFSAAVVEFQKSYVREVQTETKMEDGEFLCCDVPCYKHIPTGEVISEEEYRQRTAALIRDNSNTAAGSTRNKTYAGAFAVSPSSPAASSKTDMRDIVQRPGKTNTVPNRTLFSFNFSSR